MKKTHLELFETLASEPDGGPVEQGLIVVSTPRSGSTLFCDVLTNSGQIGICDEWFNEEYFKTYQQVLGIDSFDIHEYLDFVIRKTVGDTGVLAVHAHTAQLISVSQTYNIAIGDMQFNHMVYIYREDKIAQAVSFAKALATDCWKSNEEGLEDTPISFRDIAFRLSNIVDHVQFYKDNLLKHTDVSYAYEYFKALPPAPFNEVLKALGKPKLDNVVVSTEQQRTPATEQLARDFRYFITGEEA